MLVLTRKIGEQIKIDKGQITIKLLSHSKGVVAFGIQAPEHIDVDREEIFISKKRFPNGLPKKIVPTLR